MGQPIDRTDFAEEDFSRFRDKLGSNLKALQQLLVDPDFGAGPLTIGAELELYIVGDQGRPLLVNQEIMAAFDDPRMTLELNRFNLEYNFSPVAVSDQSLRSIEIAALAMLVRVNECAERWRGCVFPIGILPSLQPTDLGLDVMTDQPRYHALADELSRIRGGPFSVRIKGDDRIDLDMQYTTLEGVNTSFQIHLRVPPTEYADLYNAVQLVTPLALALSANSPILFGKRLWHETRVPLFKQSIDCRRPDPLHPRPARVNYGHGWMRNGILELFTEAVRLYRPIIPLCSDEDPFAVLRAGKAPALHELRLQLSTIWWWNRPVYDPADGGHVRIEMRALPAGPTAVDMMANTALIIGLARLLQPVINELLPSIPFDYCVRNFYRAAEQGLAAELIWPSRHQCEPEYRTAANILEELLPMIPEKLAGMGFQQNDYAPLMDVLRERLGNRQTGAQWQLDKLAELRKVVPQPEALREMQKHYQDLSLQNIPVSRWPI